MKGLVPLICYIAGMATMLAFFYAFGLMPAIA
jgi:hypothetical protein